MSAFSSVRNWFSWLMGQEPDPEDNNQRQRNRGQYARPNAGAQAGGYRETREQPVHRNAEPAPGTEANENRQNPNPAMQRNAMNQNQNWQQTANPYSGEYQQQQQPPQYNPQQQPQYSQQPQQMQAETQPTHVEYVVLLRSRNECKDVIAYIKSYASVFLNMEFIASDAERQRCVDMLSGAAYTLGCSLNKISPRGIYLISSPTVRVVLDPAMKGVNAAQEARGYGQQAYGQQAYAQQQYAQQSYQARPAQAAQPQAPVQNRQPAGYTAAEAAAQPAQQYTAPQTGYRQPSEPEAKPAAEQQEAPAAAQGYTPNAAQESPYVQPREYRSRQNAGQAARPVAGFGPGSPTERFQAQDVRGVPGSYGRVMTNPDVAQQMQPGR